MSDAAFERFSASEVADADKPEILRAYLRRWRVEVGVFFDGVNAKASEEELVRIGRTTPCSACNTATEPIEWAADGESQAGRRFHADVGREPALG